jgi:hypothetical protein
MSDNNLPTSGPLKASEIEEVVGDAGGNAPLVKLSEYYEDSAGTNLSNNPNSTNTGNPRAFDTPFGNHPKTKILPIRPVLVNNLSLSFADTWPDNPSGDPANGSISPSGFSSTVSKNAFNIRYSDDDEGFEFGQSVVYGAKLILNPDYTGTPSVPATILANLNASVINVSYRPNNLANGNIAEGDVELLFDKEFPYATTIELRTALGNISADMLALRIPISYGDLYGDSGIFILTVSSNQSEYNLRDACVAAGWDQTQKVIVDILEGVYITSTSTSNYALVIDDFPNGITINNNGNILGKGGNAGRFTNSGQYNGYNGGPAILFTANSDYTLVNNGNIGGGGGGGASTGRAGGGGGAGGGIGGWTNNTDEDTPEPGGAGATIGGTKGANGSTQREEQRGKGGDAGGSGGGHYDSGSDKRLKRNIKLVGKSPSGINIYEFNYIWSFKRYRGVIAQELLDSHSFAIKKGLFGFYKVKYDLIDVKFEKL